LGLRGYSLKAPGDRIFEAFRNSPENEQKMVQRTRRMAALKVIKEHGAVGYTTVEEIMRMNPKQKAQLRDNKLGGCQDPLSQKKITQVFQPIEVQQQKKHRPPSNYNDKPPQNTENHYNEWGNWSNCQRHTRRDTTTEGKQNTG
jgi:hypothetical protein